MPTSPAAAPTIAAPLPLSTPAFAPTSDWATATSGTHATFASYSSQGTHATASCASMAAVPATTTSPGRRMLQSAPPNALAS